MNPGENAATALKIKIAELGRGFWPKPDGTDQVKEIFHYCDAKGLEGIVTSKCLWASDIFSLNDASEVDYARQLVSATLSGYPQLSHLALSFAGESFIETYRAWRTYVCCFSGGSDLLSQWRAYGAGGRGFAVGFRGDLLERYGIGPPIKFSLFPIVYSQQTQEKSLNGFVQAVLKLGGVGPLLESKERTVSLEIAMSMLKLMPPLKNPAFADEREYRMLMIEPNVEEFPPLFRERPGAIIPFVKVPLDPSCFSRIVQGPTLHKEFGERALRIFLDATGLKHVKVESSVIPLRSL